LFFIINPLLEILNMIVASHIRLPSRVNGCKSEQPSFKYFSIRLWCDGIPVGRVCGYFR
jgi:hypothetical protein